MIQNPFGLVARHCVIRAVVFCLAYYMLGTVILSSTNFINYSSDVPPPLNASGRLLKWFGVSLNGDGTTDFTSK